MYAESRHTYAHYIFKSYIYRLVLHSNIIPSNYDLYVNEYWNISPLNINRDIYETLKK